MQSFWSTQSIPQNIALFRQNISNPIIKLLKINNDYVEQSTLFEYSSIPIIEKIPIT